MQKLHLVGLTTDLTGLIFSARKGAKSGSFVVPIDAQLVAVIADTVRRRNGDDGAEEIDVSSLVPAPPRPRPPRVAPQRSALTPREIQARVRAGRSIEDVAAEAGVDVPWVERFAVPIVAEQRRVIDKAVELVFDKPRVGLSALPLAGSVRRTLADRGVKIGDDAFDAGWSAFHLEDSTWVLRFAYTSRAHPQRAEWEVDLADGTVVARNRLGGQLAHVTSSRRRRPKPAEEPSSPAKPKRKAPARKRTAAKKAAAKKAASKRTASRTTAKKTSASKPRARRPLRAR